MVYGNPLQYQIEQYEKQTGKKLSVQELARVAGVSDDHIRKILRGERTGSIKVLQPLAHFFNCHIDDLIMPRKKTISLKRGGLVV